MSYRYHEQTLSSYKAVRYGQGTVYSSGCGPASLCNALDALGIASVTVKDMCAYSVKVGARVSGGTDEAALLQNAAKKYGFAYRTTSKNAELLAHLKAGGAAILHGGSAYKLFSNSGHFVAAVAASGETITILDSYWYDGKYTSTKIRRENVSVIERGVIQTSLTQCGKATADRSPSYYLLSKTTKKTTSTQEDDEVVEKTKFNIGGQESTLNAITKDGSTYVNLREYNDKLGLTTGYEDGTRTVEPGLVKLSVDGKAVSVPGMAISGTNFVAVRAAFEAAGYTVGWDGGSKTVTLSRA